MTGSLPSRPQCATRIQVQGVHIRPEAGGDAKDQARAAQALRRRAGDRPPQIRASNGPELSLAPPRRRHQRRPRRRRLQLPASPPLAAALVAPNPGPAHPLTSARPKLKSGFFTDDYFMNKFRKLGLISYNGKI